MQQASFCGQAVYCKLCIDAQHSYPTLPHTPKAAVRGGMITAHRKGVPLLDRIDKGHGKHCQT